MPRWVLTQTHKASGKMSFWLMRQTDHISCISTFNYAKKGTLQWHWSMQEAQLCSAAVLLCLALGVWSLCRLPWNLKTIKAFWSQMCCPLSDNLISVAGHRFTNRIKTQHTQLKAPKVGLDQIIGLLWSGLLWTLIWILLRICRSSLKCLEKTPWSSSIKYPDLEKMPVDGCIGFATKVSATRCWGYHHFYPGQCHFIFF